MLMVPTLTPDMPAMLDTPMPMVPMVPVPMLGMLDPLCCLCCSRRHCHRPGQPLLLSDHPWTR